MNDMKLWNVLTAEGSKSPYGMPLSCEADGKLPEGSVCVKCTDTLFLVRNGEALCLYDCEKDCFITADSLPEDDGLDGFETEISLAGDVILKTVFAKGCLKLGETEFPVRISKISEKMYLISFTETGELIVFDASRFLLYAAVNGKFAGGYVEV